MVRWPTSQCLTQGTMLLPPLTLHERCITSGEQSARGLRSDFPLRSVGSRRTRPANVGRLIMGKHLYNVTKTRAVIEDAVVKSMVAQIKPLFHKIPSANDKPCTFAVFISVSHLHSSRHDRLLSTRIRLPGDPRHMVCITSIFTCHVSSIALRVVLIIDCTNWIALSTIP